MSRRQGLFEAADKSTLFLDEIGELNVNMQSKVLRALQEREIRRVGSHENIKVDVRIIAATNKNLEEEVGKGTFREDLYYRLNVVTVQLPPLRERSTDIPQLAEYLRQARLRRGGSGADARHDRGHAASPAISLAWKRATVGGRLQRAVLLSDGQKIDYADLPIEVRFSTLPSREPEEAAHGEGYRFPFAPGRIDLETVEREFLLQAMELSAG